jgi:hypothetical protein
VQILTDDGRTASTLTMIAARYGVKPQTIATQLKRWGVVAVGLIDGRTPVYSDAEVDARMAARPGRGAHLRKR